MKPVTILAALLLSCGTSSLQAAAPRDEMSVIRERMIRSYYEPAQTRRTVVKAIKKDLKNADNPDNMVETVRENRSDANVRTFVESLTPQGCWENIDYKDTRRSSWDPAEHARRLMLMSCAYANPNSAFYRDETVRKGILSAMDYWFAGKFVCLNWWYNQIGVPRLLGPAFLIMQREMTPGQLEQAVAYMGNAKIGMTGQNKVWLAGNVLIRALLQDDPELFGQAVRAIAEEVAVSDGEGIQRDWSFHQHGAQPQFGNYGLAYACTMAGWGRMLRETRYALTPEQVAILRNLIAEGMSRVVWKQYMDVNACGRQLFKGARQGKAIAYGKALLDMMYVDPQHCGLYDRIYRYNILGRGKDPLPGFRAFERSDLGLYRSGTWMGSLKMSSERVIPYEMVNNENLRGYNLSDGALMLYHRGDEYEGIFPVWKWRLIPGVTAVYADEGQYTAVPGGYRVGKSSNVLAGSAPAPDASCGISAMSLEKPELNARKSWFFCKDYILCIGSDIAADTARVYTSVNQTLLEGKVKIREKGADTRIRHGGIEYLVASEGLKTTAGPQAGRWHDIARFYLDTATVSKPVFGLYLDHGKAPQAARYAYTVLPAPSARARKAAGGVRILACENGVHAVRHTDGLYQAVFFESGETALSEDLTVKASGPAIVLLRRGNDGKWEVTVEDPTQKQNALELSFGGNAPLRFDTSAHDGTAQTLRTPIAL